MYAGSHALLGADEFDVAPFDVVMYRGSTVFSTSAWITDAQSRGGTGPQPIPSGFFHDVQAFRFGAQAPYVYELPPLWLLFEQGYDLAVGEILQELHITGGLDPNQVHPATQIAGGVFGSFGSVVKYAAIGGVALLALNLVRRR